MPPKNKSAKAPVETIEVVEVPAAERYAENIKVIRAAHALVKKVFGVVTEDVLYDVTNMMKDDGEELIESYLTSSFTIAKSIDPAAKAEDVVSLVGAVLSDESIEENLKTAAVDAKAFFGDATTFENVVNLYYKGFHDEDVNDEGDLEDFE